MSSLIEMSQAREAPLFDKFLPVQIQDGVHDNNRQTSLVFRILQSSQPTASAGQTERVFHFELTDERDPYFLFYLDVGEQDFHSLKREQAILVEFNVFPLKLIELIELCLHSTNMSNNLIETKSMHTVMSFDNSPSTFIAKMDITTGIFSIIEANVFKQLTHISLALHAGNDNAIKLYLASRLTLTLDMWKRKCKDLESTTNVLNQESSELEFIQKELAELKSQRNIEIQSMRSQHSQEMSQLQMQSMENLEQTRYKYDSQLETIRNELENIQKDFKGKSQSYEQQISDLQIENNQFEFKIRDLTRLLQISDGDRDRLLKECEQVSTLKRNLEEEKSSLQRDFVRIESKTEALQQQLLDREESMSKTIALYKASESAHASTEERLRLYISNVESLQEQLKSTANEINRGNDVIEKLQSDVKLCKDKIKLKSEVIRKQEALINELRMKLNENDNQIVVLKESNNTNEIHTLSLKKQLEEAQERIQESNKIIASNQDVISFLNEEINKWQLGLRINSSPDNAWKKTSIANNNPNVHMVSPESNNYQLSPKNYDSPTPYLSYNNSNNSNHNNMKAANYIIQNNQLNRKELLSNHSNKTEVSLRYNNINDDNNNNINNDNNNSNNNEYIKGIQALGLDSAMENVDLNSILKSSKEYNRNNNNINDGIDISSMDYYATASKPSLLSNKSSKNNNHIQSSQRIITNNYNQNKIINSTQQTIRQRPHYEWESPDFGLTHQ
eukprot:gene13519-18137_t